MNGYREHRELHVTHLDDFVATGQVAFDLWYIGMAQVNEVFAGRIDRLVQRLIVIMVIHRDQANHRPLKQPAAGPSVSRSVEASEHTFDPLTGRSTGITIVSRTPLPRAPAVPA